MIIQKVKKVEFEGDGVLCSYQMTSSEGKVYAVPLDEANTDYQNILLWVAEVDENGESKGNTIEEAD